MQFSTHGQSAYSAQRAISAIPAIFAQLIQYYGPTTVTALAVGFRSKDCPKLDSYPSDPSRCELWLCARDVGTQDFSPSELRHELVHALHPAFAANVEASCLEEAMADHFAAIGDSTHLEHLKNHHHKYWQNYEAWKDLALRADVIRKLRSKFSQISTATPVELANAFQIDVQRAMNALSTF